MLTSANGTVSAGFERTGPVEYRRSQRSARDELHDLPKNHTVFVRGYRLGSRSLYLRSIARKIMKTTGKGRQTDYETSPTRTQSSSRAQSSLLSGPISPRRLQSTDSASVVGSINVSAMFPEFPVSLRS